MVICLLIKPKGEGFSKFWQDWGRTETENICTWPWFNWFNMMGGEGQWLNICSHFNNR